MTKTPDLIPANPSDLRLQFTLSAPLWYGPVDRADEQWDVSILMGREWHDDDACPVYNRPGGETEECESDTCPAFHPDGQPVGRMEFHRIRFDQEVNLIDVMDGHSYDLGAMAEALIDPEWNTFAEQLDDPFEDVGQHLLAMHVVELDPAWRGFGLGQYLAAEAIERLYPGSRFVACRIGFIDTDAAKQLTQEEQERVLARVAEGWRKVGFRLYDDGDVYVLQPTDGTREAALSVLRRQHERRCEAWARAAKKKA